MTDDPINRSCFTWMVLATFTRARGIFLQTGLEVNFFILKIVS